MLRPRLSTLVTDFFLLTGTPSLTMRRRGDGSKEGSGEFGVMGPREGGGLPGGLGVELHAWPCSLEPPLSPFAQMPSRKCCGAGVESWRRGSCRGSGVPASLGACASVRAPSPSPPLTVPSPQRRRGQRHQHVHAAPWGADQEWGQEVREELLSEKGASLSASPKPGLLLPREGLPHHPPPEASAPLRFEPSVNMGPEMPSSPSPDSFPR